MRRLVVVLALLAATTAGAATFSTSRPSTTNNDDSCDVTVLPAATLLLPYFEVDVAAPVSVARTTLFTVVNTTRLPQIARITLWTDRGYPVLNFNTFLTGYDVQAFNVYDMVVRGVLAPPNGTSNETPPGSRSLLNNANPNFLPNAAQTCGRASIPSALPSSVLEDVRNALTKGTSSRCGDTKIGGTHQNASGYVTIDLVANCSYKLPTDSGYFDELLYDNVLTGDYDILSPNPATGNYAGGNPLVHIRAVPEGGAAGTVVATELPYTFYSRLIPSATPKADRRQPLPSVFAARYIQGGRTAFETDFQVWREPLTSATAACSAYAGNVQPIAEIVRFDERENVTTTAPQVIITNPPPVTVTFPAASRTSSTHFSFPPLVSGDIAGWMYLNLHNPATLGRPVQNWVSVSMSSEGRYSVLMDATMLSNGCVGVPTLISGGSSPIGPGPNQP